jgi:nucleotide-binding universal stress UspA family protein
MNVSNRPVVLGIADKQPTALRLAMQAARRRGVTLRVVHSAGVPAQAAELYANSDAIDAFRTAGQTVLDDARHFIEQQPSTPVIEYVLTTRGPVSALEAEASEAQLLVVGTDDIPWYDRLLGGAVAGYLATHAACPVIAVPENTYPSTTSGGVVVTLDGDTSASGSLNFAFEEAEVRGSRLYVLHAAPPGTMAADVEASRANISEVLAGWSAQHPNVRITTHFAIDEPDDACIRATQRAELVVVGRPRHRGIAFALARPVATQVLRHTHCPVAVVPANYAGF